MPRPRSVTISPGCVPGLELELVVAVERRDRHASRRAPPASSSGRPSRRCRCPRARSAGRGARAPARRRRRRARPSTPAWPSPLSRIRWPSWMPGRDLDLERPLARARGPRRCTSVHGVSILRPEPRARRARLRADELAEDAARDLLQPAGAAARRARRDRRCRARRRRRRSARTSRRPGTAPRASSPRAASTSSISTVARDVGAARAAAAAAEQVVAEEGGEEVGEAAEVEVARAGSRRCAGRRGRSGRRARASRASRAPRRPRRPRGSAPPRRARRRRRGAARARAPRKAFLISASLASRATPSSS